MIIWLASIASLKDKISFPNLPFVLWEISCYKYLLDVYFDERFSNRKLTKINSDALMDTLI